jgi:uncharacterized membrane protein YhiD involved in acid resistance
MSIDVEKNGAQEESAIPEATNTTENVDDRGSDPRPAGQPRVRSSVRAGWTARVSKIKNKPAMAIALVLGLLVILAIGGYLIFGRAGAPTSRQAAPSAQQTPTSPSGEGEPGLFGFRDQPTNDHANESWLVSAARITLRLALGSLLAALLAFRPHRDLPILQRNPYVAQTQILLAVVAAALMMVVADNAARAFGIFAAASLVRFRTNIRDPKEITVLLISLAIGLASGVGKVEVAIILSLFSLLVLSILEYYEPEQIFRAMELTVTSRKVDETDQALREIFEKRNMISELRKVDREDPDNALGKIVYFVNVTSDLSTDRLSEEIFTSDPDNIDSIQWDQKKTSSYIYH